MSKLSTGFGFRADGSRRTYGDLSPDEQAACIKRVTNQLRGEFNDPNSNLRKNCEKILNSPFGDVSSGDKKI